MISVLESGRIWRAAERDLVASVVSYNQAIGDYSMSVTGGYQAPEEVVAMLIAKPQAVVAQASSILQRQPAQFRDQNRVQPQQRPSAGNTRFDAQPRGQNSPVGSGQGQDGFAGGQTRQKFGNGAGGTSNFNLGSGEASSRGSFAAPDVAPISKAPYGNRPDSNARPTFGPLAPAQQRPSGQDSGRSAQSQSQFGSGVVR